MKRYTRLNKRWKSAFVTALCLVCMGFAMLSFNIYADLPVSKAENDRMGELYKQGYPLDVAGDQAAEEFGHDGEMGTGGLDGLKLDGTPAPNAKPGTKGYELLHGSGSGSSSSKCSHDWVVTDSVDADCQKEGSISYACSKCGKTKTEVVAKTDHSYVLVSETEGDCRNRATQEFKCEVCGETYSEEGEFGDHAYELTEESKDATCTEDGVLTYVCAVCGDTYTEEKTATGHAFSTTKKTVVKATCTEDGYKAYVCENCGEEKEKETIPATGHEYEVVTETEPTLFTAGERYLICKTCRDAVTETIPSRIPLWVTITGGVIIVAGLVLIAVKEIRKKKRAA